jgi:hypothetical protein
VLGHPEHSLCSTDTQLALKHECHQKLLCGLKNVLQKPHKHFKGFGSGFTKLHAKLDADTLLNFAIHCRQAETRSQKSACVKTMRVHSMVLHGRVMQ